MKNLHVGRGITRGAMTVFPLWAPRSGAGRHTLSPRHLEINESDGGPDVGTLMVGNVGDRPALVMEGQLFEGGWQHRMATRSVMVGVHQRMAMDVACVEQGRWQGDRVQRTTGRRATPRIRESVRVAADVQQEVWDRVATYTAGTENPTDSFVRRLDDGRGAVDWADYRTLPGQSGVLIGLGGHPYAAELFAGERQLIQQVKAILEAAALDAAQVPAVETPGRRARRFIDRFERLEFGERRTAGVAEEHLARSPHLDASVLRWQDAPVHVRMSNVRHPVLVAG